MTEVSRPWAGTSIGDAGPYSDTQWANMYMKMIGWGANSPNRGVIAGVDDELRVTEQSPASNAVDVQTGAAIVQGRWYESDAVESFTISANGSGNPRIDTVVLRATFASQTVRLALLSGTAAATPVPPTLTQNATTWEIPLAHIAVANGFSTITNDNIQVVPDFANVPDQICVEVTNNDFSSLDLTLGRPVIWSTTDISHSNFPTDGTDQWAGVTVERIPFGSTGRICVKGYCYVHIGRAVTAGDLIGPQSVALDFTSVADATFKPINVWGKALESGSAGDYILAYLDRVPRLPYSCYLEDTAFSVPNGGAFSAVTFGVGTELFDPTGMHSTAVNTSRITILRDGSYRLSANCIYAVSAAYTLPNFAIRIDGTTILSQSSLPTATFVPTHVVNLERNLLAGQYAEVVVFQSSGAARSALINFNVSLIDP